MKQCNRSIGLVSRLVCHRVQRCERVKAFKLCILAASLPPWTLSEKPILFLQEAVPACGHEEECDVSAKFKRSLAAAAGLCEALRGTLTSTLEVSAASSVSRHVHHLHMQPDTTYGIDL